MVRDRKVIPAEGTQVRGLGILSIDPGVSGAGVYINQRGLIRKWFRMPTVAVIVGKRKRKSIDTLALHDLIREIDDGFGINIALIEKVNPFGQGVVSAFTFGKSVGVIEASLAPFGIILHEIMPQRWKAHCNLIGEDKRASVDLARRRFDLVDIRDTDTGVADAALMALYFYHTQRL